MNELDLSVVVPVYQGAPYLGELVNGLSKLKQRLESGQGRLRLREAIFVIDDAIDESEAILFELEKSEPWLRVITLSRNFGQHPATVAGILHSSGDWIVTMDEDLQHSPDDIPAMFQIALERRADLVYAEPTGRTHASAFRRWSSSAYKRAIAYLSGIKVAVHFNSFRLIRGEIARGTAAICGSDLYLDAALNWFTARIDTCPLKVVDTREQDGYRSSYSFSRLISHAGRLMFSARLRMLRFGGVIGFITVFLSLAYSGYILLRKIFLPEAIPVSGWASQMLVTLAIGGVVLLMLSIVLEYIMLIFLRIQGKPAFFTVDRRSDLDN